MLKVQFVIRSLIPHLHFCPQRFLCPFPFTSTNLSANNRSVENISCAFSYLAMQSNIWAILIDVNILKVQQSDLYNCAGQWSQSREVVLGCHSQSYVMRCMTRYPVVEATNWSCLQTVTLLWIELCARCLALHRELRWYVRTGRTNLTHKHLCERPPCAH